MQTYGLGPYVVKKLPLEHPAFPLLGQYTSSCEGLHSGHQQTILNALCSQYAAVYGVFLKTEKVQNASPQDSVKVGKLSQLSSTKGCRIDAPIAHTTVFFTDDGNLAFDGIEANEKIIRSFADKYSNIGTMMLVLAKHLLQESQ